MSAAQSRFRATFWLCWTVVGTLLLAGAFLAGRLVTSPWAQAQANSEQVIQVTVPVARGELARPTTTMTGTVALGARLDVAPSPAGTGTDLQVVTANRAGSGDLVSSGDLLVEVSDRPLFGLHLPFALYRDLHLGDTGADVRAVQGALGAAGLTTGAVDGVFGHQTARAVGLLYSRSGAVVPPVSDELVAQLVDLETQVAERDAARIPTAGPDGVLTPAPALTASDTALDARLEEARDAAGPWLPAAEIVALTSHSMLVLDAAPVGAVLGDAELPAVSLRGEGAVATFRSSLVDAQSLTVGAPVTVATLDGTGSVVTAQVLRVSDFLPADDVETVPGYDVVVGLDDPDGLSDGTRVTISPDVGASTETGLVVPLLAVREDSDGTYVLVAGTAPAGGATTRPLSRVDVRPGLQQDGMVIVGSDELAVGDHVLVGAAG